MACGVMKVATKVVGMVPLIALKVPFRTIDRARSMLMASRARLVAGDTKNSKSEPIV